MIRIFLAHASEDKAAVTDLYNRLKASGFEPWLDKVNLLPGQSWRAEIPKAIKNSHVFIACLSQKSIQKQGYIQREFKMALNEMADRPSGQIYLIPVRLDDCRIPDLRQEDYGISLSDYQWVNFFESDGYDRLVKGIETGFADVLAQPGASQPALETFSFEVVTVDRKGTVNHREQKSAAYYRADLGSGVYLDLVKIPWGRFWMGSPDSETDRFDREGPQHKVQVPEFYMGKYPVTQRQWRAVSLLDDVDIELKPDPSQFKGDSRPVERVSWYETVEFCQRLARHTGAEYRLPSEAEWEYACRAGTATSFHFGATITTELANYRGTDAKEYGWSGSYGAGPKGEYRQQTTDIGRFSANAFGLYGMHGNVYDWCQDHWHDNYDGAPTDGSAWITDNEQARRVVRGGAWNYSPRYCRSAYRVNGTPGYRVNYIGFRVVCSAPRIPQT
ncbi:SUMF1/EgtB/PvdO family nonheme iron enzyme [Adonisia turfae]|uniref:TIR domain-containing protein n=1 Tax=Adonisia turfae CCMR0081 TaxID=2292702 RepID=A0A6M0RX90_9CYAN|nr:SUMF1/EgtB/PvdO family nonheme iron enzyme [Adonisia turfae]NEZ60332.1 TIR domain-containing protein [Adonisia turfae CCMR0081]